MVLKNVPSRSSSPRSSDVLLVRPFLQHWLFWVVGGFVLGHWHGRFFDSAAQDVVRIEKAPSLSSVDRTSFGQHNGWTTIQVFRGTTSGIDSPNKSSWHSQMRQDELVFSLLRNKTDGYFVDLAANDAIQLSNTYSLERDWGWNGVCIEPNPIYWYNLSTFRSCDTIAAVVGSRRMEGAFNLRCRHFYIHSFEETLQKCIFDSKLEIMVESLERVLTMDGVGNPKVKGDSQCRLKRF